MNNIRNFVITAHIDHGKSTLADRLLEITGTVEQRRMKPQYLDQLELERERGITIKMAPVRMSYTVRSSELDVRDENNKQLEQSNNFNKRSDQTYILNLIDTPGHSDFSYEVSRALAAVEGAVLLVDVSKGIQAQTLANLRAARKAGLKIIGAANKIDLNHPKTEENIKLLADLLGVPVEKIFRVSGKTGEGVEKLLEEIVKEVPPPRSEENNSSMPARALIFDSLYDEHKGIMAFVRIFGGEFKTGDDVFLAATGAKFKIKEVGCFAPELKSANGLSSGEIGYIATGLKEPELVKIGDTILTSHFEQRESASLALSGYKEPQPVVFISFYPDGRTKFDDLKIGLEKLRLTDAALVLVPDKNEALGRGFKVGFLGQLHFEITSSRLEREFGLEFLTTFPSVAYRVKENGETKTITDIQSFPENPEQVFEPLIKLEIISPAEYLSQIISLKNIFRFETGEVEIMGNSAVINAKMPLAELFRGFDDKLKSVSSGFASFNYEPAGEAPVKAEKMEILVASEVIPALTRAVLASEAKREGRTTLERLKNILPRQQFAQALQARVRGRIVAREDIPALKKLLGNFGKTGGDRTRKMKLWKKQKKGKEKLKEMAKVNLSAETFREILKK